MTVENKMIVQQYDPFHEGPQLGIIKDEPNEVYHATDAISNSKLACFRKRKYKFYKKYVKKNLIEEEKEKDYFVFGGAGHCLVLEGQAEFDRRYIVEPVNAPKKPTKARHEYKAKISPEAEDRLQFWEHFRDQADTEDKEVLTQKQMRVLQYVKWSIDENEVATSLLSEIMPELTFRCSLGWTLAQVRVDGFIESCSHDLAEYLNEAYAFMLNKEIYEGDSIALDLKTCVTLTRDDSGSFFKHFGELGYYIQDQFYREVVSKVMGKKLNHFLFIGAEKQEPFETVVGSTDQEDLALAYSELQFDLEELKKCYQTNKWFSFSQEKIIMLSIPGYKRSQAEQRLKMERSRNE